MNMDRTILPKGYSELQSNDVIVKVNGSSFTTTHLLARAIRSKPVELEIVRNGSSLKVMITD